MVMVSQAENLPKFKNPPVVELALGVQYDRIEKLNAAYLGGWWQKIKENFPSSEEKSALPPIVEPLDLNKPVEVRLNITNKPPPSRWWFLSKDQSELIQVQNDRFVYNWRKNAESPVYPSYENLIEKFINNLKSFCVLVEQENLGSFVPNMCEIAYVNHIVSGKGWNKHSQVSELYAPFSSKYSMDFLPDIEAFEFNASHLFADKNANPLGRLKIGINSGFRASDKIPVVVINMNAYSPPKNQNIQGIKEALDESHGWGVKGFTSITTTKMHEIWEQF